MKKIIILLLIILFAIPVLSFGSSITLSLISGKTPTEAIEILATQIDNIFDRISSIENKQNIQEQTIDNILKDMPKKSGTTTEENGDKKTKEKEIQEIVKPQGKDSPELYIDKNNKEK